MAHSPFIPRGMAVLVPLVLCFAGKLPLVQAAATTSWTGATSTSWATGTNWSAGVPSSSIIAVFDSTFASQPAYSGTTLVSGLWLATGVGQDVAITGSGALTLTGTDTINGNANTAILLDDTANHSLSIASSNPVVTLANSTKFLVNNAGTLTIYKTNLNGNTLTLGGTNAAGNIAFTSNIGTTSSAGAVIVDTAGTVTFSAPNAGGNDFTGGLTLNNGTLKAVGDNASLLGQGTLTLGGGDLQLIGVVARNYGRNTAVNGNAKITSDRTTAGGGLTQSLGTLSIGANTLTVAKGTNVTSGTAGVTFGATTLTGDATFSLNSGTKLTLGAVTNGTYTATFTGGGDFAQTGVWGSGSGGLTFDSAFSGIATLNQANTFSGNVSISGGIVSASVAGVAATSGPLGIGTTTVNSGGELRVTTASALLGSSGITLNGGTLRGYTSATAIFGGNVTVAANSSIINERTGSASTTTLTQTYGTLSINGSTLNIGSTNNQTGNNSGVTFGATSLMGNATFNVTNNDNNTNITLLTLGALDDGGTTARTLTKAGNGTLTLATAATSLINGTIVTVTGGTLNSNHATALGSLANVSVASGATLAVGASQTFGALNGDGTFNLGANTLTLGNTNNLDGDFSGSFASSTGALVKNGTGKQTLSGNNLQTGSLTLNAGTLRATTNATALGGGSLILTGGTLELANDTGLAFGRNTTVSGSTTVASDRLTAGAGVTHSLAGLNIGGQTLTIAKGANVTSGSAGITFGTTTFSANGTVFDTAADTNLTLGSLSGNFTFNKQGAGQLTLNNAANANRNSTAGAVTLNNGTLKLGSASALGTSAVSLAINGGTLDLAIDSNVNAYPVTIGGNTTIISNRATAGAGITHLLGTLSIGANELTIAAGSNVTSGTGVVRFGATTLTGNSTFSIGSGAQLYLAAMNNSAFTPTFTGAGSVIQNGVWGGGTGGITFDSNFTGTATLSQANTFSGQLGILSGTVITSTTAGTGTGSILLGHASGSNDAALLINPSAATVSVANAITVQGGSTGTVTLGSNANVGNTLSATFSGNITLNRDVILSPYLTTLSFTPASGSAFTGTGGIIVSGTGLGVSSSGQAYGVNGANANLTATSTFSGDTRVRAGTLTVTSSVAGNVDNRLGTSSNAVLVGDTTGIQSARLAVSGTSALVSFSRNVTVQAGSGGIAAVGGGNGGANGLSTFSGGISLEKSAYLSGSSTFTGAITKAAGAIGATGITLGNGGIFISGGINGQVTTVSNAGNNYDGGTTVGMGVLAVTGSGVLGTGNVVVESGTLRIASAANIASGKKVLVGPLGQLTVASAVTPANLQSLVDSASSGAIGLASGTSYNSALNLALIGNGLMALGTDYNSSATYGASSLGANSDGNYRLGWGGSTNPAITLAITNGVLVGSNAQVIIGGSQGFVGFNGPMGGSGTGFHTEGFVTLNGANTYGGGTVINSGSRLVGQAQTTGSPFGSSTGALTLNNGAIQLKNSTNLTTATTVGNMGFQGVSVIQVDGTTGGSNTFTLGEITRNNRGVLQINTTGTGAVLGSTAFVKTSGTAPVTTTVVIDSSGTTAQMAPAYFYDVNDNALTYGANGFAPITTSLNTLASAFALTGGSAGNGYVKATGTETIGASGTIAALTFTPGTAVNTNISSSVLGDITLTIKTGLLNAAFSGNNGGPTIGSATNRINIDFNGQEAIIGARVGQNGGLTINGVLSNTGGNGLTKIGPGALVLASYANTFTGTVAINEGAISITSDSALGDADNDLLLNGGALYSSITSGNLTLNANRTVTVGPVGGTFSLSGVGSTATTQTYGNLTIDGKITGTGAFLNLMTATNFATAVTPNTFALTNAANDFVAPIYVGQSMSGRLNLVFTDDRQLGNASNTVTLIGGNSQLYYAGNASTSTNRGIIFSDQGGGIEVANAVTLTASGPISGSGMFNKNGIGTLSLTGSATNYSGTVNVIAGVLNVQNANALGASTAVITGSSGVSGGGVYVQSGAALEVQGGIALGNAGGKTTYLNGSGISNGGALRNLSGNNSNAGALILQTASTIGSDAGRYTVSGVVSGAALTKVGAGELEFTAANTYVGGTTVTGGTLIVNNSTGSATGTGNVSLGAGTKLGGSGRISGLVSTGGLTTTLAPGNSPGTLTLGSLDASAGSSFVFELGTVSDLIAVTGNFTGSSFANGLNFSFSDAGGLAAGNPYTLISFGSSTGLDYSDLVAGVIPSGYELDQSFGTGGFLIGANALQVQFQLAAIPEPGALPLIGLGLAALTIFRRRRR